MLTQNQPQPPYYSQQTSPIQSLLVPPQNSTLNFKINAIFHHPQLHHPLQNRAPPPFPTLKSTKLTFPPHSHIPRLPQFYLLYIPQICHPKSHTNISTYNNQYFLPDLRYPQKPKREAPAHRFQQLFSIFEPSKQCQKFIILLLPVRSFRYFQQRKIAFRHNFLTGKSPKRVIFHSERTKFRGQFRAPGVHFSSLSTLRGLENCICGVPEIVWQQTF
ncbi:hypothetical protein SS50377_25149 [Spironucleus salmonicida]|uniref:Uncharacterized protein n=1 Tax=Spironucleus salmonicida TaxID=348837 RepID=A0A9P8LRU4_9EUKA|nr:hypothetical protein SS50377_25149 [Spironucleus salmonicida]